ncbi:hypothetical protein EYF80_007854 [Liparis tanakae]|uniref:Uncharacterized protein n=1 Tax=Liparis tanakae TaxID=230148 RepID=A0A4Z2IVN4_9TELE|nr:hypothetical protein EYF80_007854 [Liparis tanakae]
MSTMDLNVPREEEVYTYHLLKEEPSAPRDSSSSLTVNEHRPHAPSRHHVNGLEFRMLLTQLMGASVFLPARREH